MRALALAGNLLIVVGVVLLSDLLPLAWWEGFAYTAVAPVGATLLMLGVCLVVSLVVAADGAFGAIRRTRLGHLTDEDGSPAVGVQHIHDRSVDLSAVARIAEVMALATVSVVASVWVLPHLTSALGGLSGALAVIVLAASNAIVLIDYVAHAAGVRHAERYAVALAGVASAALTLGHPLLIGFRALGRWTFGSPVGLTRVGAGPISEDGIMRQVDVAEEEGVLEEDEGEMIRSIIDLADTTAREVMSHRIDIVAVSETATLDAAVARGIAAGHSRIPVYEGSVDRITGVFYLKDALRFRADTAPPLLAQLVRKPYFVPETKKVDDLLREMQSRRIHLAIVVDEYGGTAGLVTIEDILEEIVGDIQDEFDFEEAQFSQIGEDIAVVDAAMTLDDLNDAFGLALASDDVDSIGGLIYAALGRVPAVGDSIVASGASVAVEELDGNRITRVRVSRRGAMIAPDAQGKNGVVTTATPAPER